MRQLRTSLVRKCSPNTIRWVYDTRALANSITRCRNPPHCIADIVSNEKVAAFVESKRNWPTARFFVGTEETGHDILGGAVGMPVRKWHVYDFVAIQLRPVPAAVFADERAAVIGRGQGASRVKHEAKRSDMRAKGIVGRDRLGDEIGALRLNPGIESYGHP